MSNSDSVSLLLLLMGAGLLIWALREGYYGLVSARWPTTTGTIISAEPREQVINTKGIRRTNYAVVVRYRYVVNKQTFVGERVQFGWSASFSDPFAAQQYGKRFRPKRQISVSYSPTNPSFSVLKPGLNLRLGVILLASLLLISLAYVVGVRG